MLTKTNITDKPSVKKRKYLISFKNPQNRKDLKARNFLMFWGGKEKA